MVPVLVNHFYFDYGILFQSPLSLACYFFLVLSFIGLYLTRNIYVRGTLFFLACLFGLYAGRIGWIGLILIILFGGVYYYALNASKARWRGLSFILLLASAAWILFLRTPDIYNWQVVSKAQISPGGVPYSLWLNFDKSLIGLFFVWFSALTLANGGKWKPVLKTGVLTGLAAILVLLPAALLLGFIGLDPKATNFLMLWAVHNLFFVCFAEEALFRGLIQRFLTLHLQRFKMGKIMALIISAFLFGIAHYPGGLIYAALATVAGLFYGFAFMKTDKIEASVLTHFMVNLVQFLAFTYPALSIAFS